MTILEFLTGFISAFDNPVYDCIFGGLLVTIAGSIAYWIGGKLGYEGKLGFVLWLITAVAVYAVIACIIRLIMWLVSIPWWVWVIIAGVALIAMITVIILKKKAVKKS